VSVKQLIIYIDAYAKTAILKMVRRQAKQKT